MWKITALLLSLSVPLAQSDLVLSEKIMDLTLTAAMLSSLAYENKTTAEAAGVAYKSFGFYSKEPDQALTAQTKDGYCFVAFRGTSLTWDDWKQNLEIGNEDICVDLAGTQKCCTSRKGFYDAYDTVYRAQVEQAVRNCAKTCDDLNECVVITGHSQGGAIAAVAALFLADLNPYIITFGQPATIDSPCDLIPSARMYRFVNTKVTDTIGIAYDPVPMAPGLGASHFGNMIVLGPDPSGVAFIGLDAQDYLHPYTAGVEAHFMVNGSTPYSGYEDRIRAVMAPGIYPIRNNGYVAGSLCSENKECESKKCGSETHFSFNRCIGVMCKVDSDCETERCDSGVCISKAGSCMACDEDSDCAGAGKCTLFKCSNEKGLMDNNCICLSGADCDSGRCEGFTNPQCEAQLSLGATCNEHSDCLSGYCGWDYICEMPGDEKNGIGPIAWVLIGLIAAAGLFLTYKFCKQRRDGYSEVPSTTMDV